MLRNPEIANRSCESCQKWVYLEKGPKAGTIMQRGGVDVPRPPGTKPPCWECPKKSPEDAHRYELSDKSVAVLMDWKRGKATCGAYFTGRRIDSRTSDLFVICDTIYEDVRDKSNREAQESFMMQLVTAKVV